MRVLYTPKFVRQYKKIPSAIKDKVEQREAIFKSDPFSSILKTHKLKGDLAGLWSYSVDFTYRIVFEFDDTQDIAILHEIGTHDLYK